MKFEGNDKIYSIENLKYLILLVVPLADYQDITDTLSSTHKVNFHIQELAQKAEGFAIFLDIYTTYFFEKTWLRLHIVQKVVELSY